MCGQKSAPGSSKHSKSKPGACHGGCFRVTSPSRWLTRLECRTPANSDTIGPRPSGALAKSCNKSKPETAALQTEPSPTQTAPHAAGAVSADTHGNLLTIRDLRISFDLQGEPLEVVKGASLRIKPGSVVALVGESGSGKSVISQTIMGILPRNGSITSGEIAFSDPAKDGAVTDIATLPQSSDMMRRIRGGRISIIFQEPMTSLSPVHTIGNQIEEALVLHTPTRGRAAREETEQMLGRVGFPNPQRAYDMYPFELSGGLRQRAMIAKALICRPALLIADEPSTALDVTVQAQVLALLKDLQAEFGMAMLLITHDLGVVANMADEVVVIYHGEIMEAGPVKEIFGKPQHPYLKALLAAVPHFDMQPGERLVSLRSAAPAKAGNGKSKKAKPETAAADDLPILKVDSLVKSFQIKKGSFFSSDSQEAVRVVDNVSFEIRRGECLGLVGESGCGKTTVSKLITRALTPDSGRVTFSAKPGEAIDLTSLDAGKLKAARSDIQMIFQDPFGSLNPRMTVLEILREPLAIHGMGNHAAQLERVTELMRQVGLDPRYLSRYPHSFSGGQRQRIGIARALALDPSLIICDEPVSALDVSVQAQILNLLKDLQSELNLTYLFISHNLAVVDYMADRIAVMWKGRLVEVAQRSTLFRNPRHPYTRALLEAVPYPDLERQLDFEKMRLRPGSDTANWDEKFRPSQDGGQAGAMELLEVEPGHRVLVRSGTPASEVI